MTKCLVSHDQVNRSIRAVSYRILFSPPNIYIYYCMNWLDTTVNSSQKLRYVVLMCFVYVSHWRLLWPVMCFTSKNTEQVDWLVYFVTHVTATSVTVKSGQHSQPKKSSHIEIT